MRRIAVLSVLCLSALALAVPAAQAAPAKGKRTYLVLYKKGASFNAVRRAIRRAGGRIVRENRDIGLALVSTRSRSFKTRAGRAAPVAGVARNRRIGRVRPKRTFERIRDGRRVAAPKVPPVFDGDPFSPLQWDMQLIDASPTGSYRDEQGSHGVRVGVIDTGIDGKHPDIAANFDSRLSRNFTADDPTIDGPCAQDIDGSCAPDPANVDEDGHGTHVASTIGSPLNGVGMAGVAPKVDLVNLRAGQDSGFFFLIPTVDALTFAADHGIDVVNMSFYTDPWLFNCTGHPALDPTTGKPTDSPAEQREQQVIVAATVRALEYAHRRNVTLIAAAGNEQTDLGNPTLDETSPDYPVVPGDPSNTAAEARPRKIDNTCLSMPSEGPHVINVSSIGPSTRKAFYSNYGTEQIRVAAPGGDSREFFGTPAYRDPGRTEILAAYPKNVGIAEGTIDPTTGDITPDGVGFVLRDPNDPNAYYQYIQGTSMASPHAVGVAALIIARYGHRDWRHGGLTLRPSKVERILEGTATPHACPAQEPFHYPGQDAIYDATCLGGPQFNGFYGHGIVNALRAVQRHR
jgi:lantibiotic leader peptide-processing serine protease